LKVGHCNWFRTLSCCQKNFGGSKSCSWSKRWRCVAASFCRQKRPHHNDLDISQGQRQFDDTCRATEAGEDILSCYCYWPTVSCHSEGGSAYGTIDKPSDRRPSAGVPCTGNSHPKRRQPLLTVRASVYLACLSLFSGSENRSVVTE
jgi:hypothetical protein